MSESIETPIQETQTTDQYKTFIVVLTVFTTVLAAIIAALQGDAGIRADVANRDSQYLTVQVSGELHRAGLEANYEFMVLGDYLKNLQESTVLQLTALEQDEKERTDDAVTTRNLAAVAEERANTGMKFSVLYKDPRYAPQGDEFMPKAEQYILDLHARSVELLAQQNEQADAYIRWNRKSDSYMTALTILAVAFSLFGIAQAVKNARMRLSFAGFGIVLVVFSLLVTFITLVS